MSKALTQLFTLALALISAGCAHPVSVSTQYDAHANFAGMRTFAWSAESDSQGDGDRALRPEMSRHVRSEVEAALSAKGLHKSESANADAIVAFTAAVDHQHQVISMYSPKPGGGTPRASEWVAVFDLGTLTITLSDRTSGQPVWFSSAQAEIEQGGVEGQVSAAISKMLSGFPPSPRR